MKTRKITSLLLSFIMCLGIILPILPTFAAEQAPSAEIVVEQPAASSDSPYAVDLTDGNYTDWAHFGLNGASAINRKANVTNPIIGSPSAIQSGGIEAASADDLNNYRLQFVWSDGNPVESQTTKSFVKNGKEGIKLNFNMPAGSWEIKLFASTYNELADVVVYDSSSNEIARQNLGTSFSSWAHMPKAITIQYYCAVPKEITVHIARTEFDASQWPGLSLGAAAVKAIGTPKSQITASATSGGTASGGGEYDIGDEVTLTATPNSGYLFKEWQVENGNLALADKTANPVTFEAPAGGARVKAVFVTEEGLQDLTQYINVKIGTSGASNTLIGTQRPNSSVNPGPDTNPQNGCTGYNANGQIRGFSQMHVSGTGVGKYGQVLISPQVGLATRLDGHDSPKSNENPTCSEYSVTLNRYDIDASFTPADHATIYKFTYPQSDNANIVVDLAHNICNTNAKNVKVNIGTDANGNTFISGSGYYTGGWANDHNVYFYAVVNKAPKATGVYDANGAKPGVNNLGPVDVSSTIAGLGGYMTFDTQEDETIMMKVGMSFKSVDQAKIWLNNEIPAWDYEAVKAETNRQWNEQLNKIVIEGNISETEKQIFYTAMYHTCIMPRDRSGDFAHFGDVDMIDDHFAGWDTWRTLYPLYAITNPDLVAKTVNSFITRYKTNGYVKDSMCAGTDMAEQQGGDDVDNIIADAYAKKIPGVNWNEAYEIVKNHADNYRLDCLGWGSQSRVPNPNSNYKVLGWIPGDNNLTSRKLCCSYQLEYAYNDYCAAQMAKDLGSQEDYEKYLARSNSWVNIWRSDVTNNGYTGFIWPKNADGSWTVPSESLGFTVTKNMGSWNEYFYEASSWNYSFFVPHDIPQLIEKMGGNDTFCDRLKLGIERGWVDYGNEPAFLATYLFDYTTKPYLTTDAVALQRKKFSLNGVPGNDDSGAMSSWYIFSSMGFFPNAGQNLYYFTSPCYDKSTINLANGKKFTIIANNLSSTNKYIQSVTLNGVPYKSTMFTHDDIANGGELVFEMGSTPVDYTKSSEVSVKSVTPVENKTVIDLDNARYTEWAHFGKAKANYINRNAGADENPVIAAGGISNVSNYWTEEDLNTWAPNSPGFTWTTGNPDQTSAVGEQEVNKRIVWSQSGLQFNLDIPAGSSEVELYVTGVRAGSTIEVLNAGGQKIIDQETLAYLGAGNGTRQYKKVLLSFDCPTAERFTVKLLIDPENKEPADYSIGISAATFRKIGIFNVVFNTNGGTVVPAQNVKDGDLVSMPAAPVRTGYRFDGWYKDASFTAPWNFDTDTVSNDTNIYAKWIAICTVKFDSNGGSAVEDQTIEEGNYVVKPEDPQRIGNNFVGWFKDADLTIPWDFDTDIIRANTTIYAKWSGLPEAAIKNISTAVTASTTDLSSYTDWAQFGSGTSTGGISMNRKDIADGDKIITSLSSVDYGYSTNENNANQPFGFTWNNGTPTAEMETATKYFGWSQKGLDLKLNIPAGSYDAELYITGIRAGATVEILDKDGNTAVAKQQLWANTKEARQYGKVSLSFYCPQARQFTVRLLVNTDDCEPQNYSVGIAAATIEQITPGISTVATGNGTVTGEGLYNVGSNVTLTAVPDEGYRLKEWKVISGDLTLDSASENPLTFTMPSTSVTIEAVFIKQEVHIESIDKIANLSSVNLSEDKYIDWAYLGYKDRIIRKADVSDSDKVFVNSAKAVSGGLTEENMDQWNANSSPYFNWTGGTPTATGTDIRYIVWNGSGIEFDVDMPAGKSELGLFVSSIRAGALIEILGSNGEPVLNQHLWNNPGSTRYYEKINLDFDCKTAGRYKVRFLVDINDAGADNISVSLFAAAVERLTSTFNITATAGENGSVSGSGKYEAGQTATLTATPDEGYIFDGWYENGELVENAGAEYSFTVSESRALEAKFAKEDKDPSFTADKAEYVINENVTFTALLPEDIMRVSLVNESGRAIVMTSAVKAPAGAGFNEWTINAEFATKGSRSIKLYTAVYGAILKDSGLAADFDVVSVKAGGDDELAVISVSAPESATVNEAFAITVKTTTSTTKIGIFNSDGKAMGKISQSYVDKNGERTWTITTSVGTKGERTFTVKAGDNKGNWGETVKTYAITVNK